MASLELTPDQAANELIGSDPFALTLGLLLYQQIPTEKAFIGPSEVRKRIGHLDPGKIASMDVDDLVAVFQEKPAIHRFPANMAKRAHALAEFVADELGGDVASIWHKADNADDVLSAAMRLPGFGEYKARVLIGVLGHRLGIRPKGWEAHAPDWPSIADVATFDDVAVLKERKKAWKSGQK